MPSKSRSRSSPPLSGWFVVSLRPVGQQRSLLRAAVAAGASGLSLPGLRLRAREDTRTDADLDAALRCGRVVFTSPAAVGFSVRLRTLRPRSRRQVFALGEGTRAALRRAGIGEVRIPAIADSEGLLAMREFAAIEGARIGLVIAPGGRGLIAAQLRARGATLAIAEVYVREPAQLRAAHVQSLLAARGHGAVCITSAEALRNVLAALPDAARTVLLRCVAVASSERLLTIARDAGFRLTIRADGPMPRELIRALASHAQARHFR